MPIDLSQLSDEDLQIYEDLLRQKQGGQSQASPQQPRISNSDLQNLFSFQGAPRPNTSMTPVHGRTILPTSIPSGHRPMTEEEKKRARDEFAQTTGLTNIGKGVSAWRDPNSSWDDKAGGTADILFGTMKAASPVLLGAAGPAAVAAPGLVAKGLLVGGAAGVGTELAGEVAGMPGTGKLLSLPAATAAGYYATTTPKDSMGFFRGLLPSNRTVDPIARTASEMFSDVRSQDNPLSAVAAVVRKPRPKNDMVDLIKVYPMPMKGGKEAVDTARRGTLELKRFAPELFDRNQAQRILRTVPEGEYTGLVGQRVSDAKAAKWAAWEEKVAPLRNEVQVPGNELAAAVMKATSPNAVRGDRSAYTMDLINSLRGRMVPLREAEMLLREANLFTESTYGMAPGKASSRFAQDVSDVGALRALASQIRKLMYTAVDSRTGGQQAAEIMKDFGALSEVEGYLQDLTIPAMRSMTPTQAEQALQHLGNVAMSGGKSALMTGVKNVLTRNKTIDNSLFEALIKFKSEPAALAESTPTPIRGLLESGARPMPPVPDTSGPIFRPPTPGMGISPETGARLLPPASTHFMPEVPPNVQGVVVPTPIRPGAGMSPDRANRLLPSPSGTPLRTRGAITPEPPPNSYPGQEPETGLYRDSPSTPSPARFSDPFGPLTGDQRTRVLRQLATNKVAEITVNGQKMQWRKEPDGSIRRLR